MDSHCNGKFGVFNAILKGYTILTSVGLQGYIFLRLFFICLMKGGLTLESCPEASMEHVSHLHATVIHLQGRNHGLQLPGKFTNCPEWDGSSDRIGIAAISTANLQQVPRCTSHAPQLSQQGSDQALLLRKHSCSPRY